MNGALQTHARGVDAFYRPWACLQSPSYPSVSPIVRTFWAFLFSGGTLQFLNASIIHASRGLAGLRLGLALIEYTHSHQRQSKSELRTISRSRDIIRCCHPFVLSNFHVLYFGSYLGTQSTSVGHLALGFDHALTAASNPSFIWPPYVPWITSYLWFHIA